jgi:hypothetical protein
MANNTTLNISSLDFDVLKYNLKQYLAGQDKFKDYNFEGSNFNVLLDVLSYNSYLNSFYLNMISSEMFLDSAQKLDSVISHAKELNYLPRSARSAKTVVDFTIETADRFAMRTVENPFIIPKGTTFSGYNSNGNFTFITDQEHSVLSSNSIYNVTNLEIFEGSYTQDSYIVDYTVENQRFVLSNPNIDIESLQIIVNENNTNTIYSYVENLYNLSSNSYVYFLQPTFNQKYEFLFGDGNLGYKPLNGSYIIADYRVTNASKGNGVSSIILNTDLGVYNGGQGTSSDIIPLSSSAGGADQEGIESIRFNAPRHYQTQSRCITTKDYIVAVLQEFPDVEYVNVYGGAVTNTAVEYGTVYISPSTYSGATITDNRKIDIQSYINSLSPIGIRTKIIDPDYLYITISSVIHVNFRNTSSTPSLIISKSTAAIKNYNDKNLKNFNTAFRLSKLEQSINDCDIGILSNESDTKVYKQFNPVLYIGFSIYCNFFNPIKKGSVSSSVFATKGSNYIITDYIDGVTITNGLLYAIEQNADLKNSNYYQIGTVDYLKGIIVINEQIYTDIGAGVKIYGTPSSKDIYCVDNTIISIDVISGLTLTTVSE